MTRSLLVIFLTVLALHAQTPAETARLRIEKTRVERSIDRQRQALKGMAESIAIQQRSTTGQRLSISRRPLYSASRDFFASPAAALTPPLAIACDPLPPGQIDELVSDAAQSTSVAPELIRSVMRQESGFRPCAVSAKGALGLMQLVPATANELGVTDAFDPEANVLGGARLLKLLLDRYGGDLSLTLSAYNAGTRKVDAAMSVPMIPETIDYVSRILSRLADSQSVRDNAPDISLRLMGSDGGK
jgi:soluble lytic murein transglycosylase-like protein